MLSSFHLNGHTLGFHPQTQKLELPFHSSLCLFLFIYLPVNQYIAKMLVKD